MALLSLPRLLLLLNLSILASAQEPLPSPTAVNVSVAVGQRAELICSVVGYGGTEPLSITIRKASAPTMSRTGDGVTTAFVIVATRIEDAGMYLCTANSATTGQTSETGFFLDVRDVLALITPPMDAAVPPGDSAVFSCVFNRDMVVTWFKGAASSQPLSQSSKYQFSDIGEKTLTIADTAYVDRGAYVCQVTDNSRPVRFSATLSLVPAYVPLRSEGQSGQSLIVTSDQLQIKCPVSGVPGPSIVYWKKQGMGTGSPTNLTSRESSAGDPFVDSQGRLDFSRAGVEDEGRYLCTAVDELGEQASHVFFVEITHISDFFLWNQWYMILVYCVVGMVILASIVIAIWFSISVKFNWCVEAKKVVRQKIRVRRSDRPLVMKTPVPRDEGIDAYAMEDYEAKDDYETSNEP